MYLCYLIYKKGHICPYILIIKYCRVQSVGLFPYYVVDDGSVRGGSLSLLYLLSYLGRGMFG